MRFLRKIKDRLPKSLRRYCTKETALYVLFGGLTTVVNYAIYYPLTLLGVSYKYSNIIAWVVAVVFAYFTNKLFVFESKSFAANIWIKEFIFFAAARIISLALEEGFLILTVEAFGASELIMKILVSIIVVIVNYFFSKLLIFKRSKYEK